MDDNKICFIICGNNEFLCSESLHYISTLQSPNGIAVEYITICDVDNLLDAYLAGRQETDAKYKVYLNENVFITNPNFIEDILNIFTEHTNIELIGALGYPTDFSYCIGHLTAQGSNRRILSHNYTGQIGLQTARYLDINFLATSQDIEWESDPTHPNVITCSNAQSVVLLQEVPWCVYDNGLHIIPC